MAFKTSAFTSDGVRETAGHGHVDNAVSVLQPSLLRPAVHAHFLVQRAHEPVRDRPALALLKERFEKPGEVEKLIEEIELEQSKDFRDVDSLKEYMARVLAGEVPMVQKNKAWNAKVMLQHGSDTGQQLYDTK
jgi:hypothetical protein